MEATSFLEDGFLDPSQPPEAFLRSFKGQIESICDLLDFGTNLQRVNPIDIDEWEQELRGILKEIKRLKTTSSLDSLLDSTDAVKNLIETALVHLYVASDILQKEGVVTIKEREKFYERLRAGSHCLSEALEYFLI